VVGKVMKVGMPSAGSMFLDFCEDYRNCPFVVIVFRSNLKDIGDVRVLEGQEIEITGKIQEWNDRAEIILKHLGQLEGMAERLPPCPKPMTTISVGATAQVSTVDRRQSIRRIGGRSSHRPMMMRSETAGRQA
jgi:hypothetical protein